MKMLAVVLAALTVAVLVWTFYLLPIVIGIRDDGYSAIMIGTVNGLAVVMLATGTAVAWVSRKK